MSEKRRRGRGLFRRIIISFVGGVLLFMAAAVLLTFLYTRGGGAGWVSTVVEVVDAHADEIIAELHDVEARQLKKKKRRRKERHAKAEPPHHALEALATPIGEEMSAWVRIVPARGFNAMVRRGMPLPHGLELNKKQRNALKRGSPIVLERRLGPPRVVWRVYDHENDRIAAFVIAERHGNPPMALAAGITLLLLSLLAFAWPLARSLTSRLHELEMSTQAFAEGDLDARARVDKRADEVDQLAVSFNDMATRIAQLITGQRTLLTNVSHELRTPLARMRVLLELLEERTARAPYGEDPGTARVRQGLEELGADVAEMNQLVQDLLTSGRLELGRAVQPRPIDMGEIGPRVAAKVRAEYIGAESDGLEGDPMLIERVLSNLLANARRACPNGRIEVDLQRSAGAQEDQWLFVVQDEGDGVPVERRKEIFEPFSRLDSARSRDAGGVGLGLHLSRQVAKAHGGTLECVDRPDGKPGARFELRIPA